MADVGFDYVVVGAAVPTGCAELAGVVPAGGAAIETSIRGRSISTAIDLSSLSHCVNADSTQAYFIV